jgi:hypothetical protein
MQKLYRVKVNFGQIGMYNLTFLLNPTYRNINFIFHDYMFQQEFLSTCSKI